MTDIRHPNKLSKDFIHNILPKTVTSDGCWIASTLIASVNGKYTIISINHKLYLLHRLSICLYTDTDYNTPDIEACHSDNCSTRCFNPEHLRLDTKANNMNDSVRLKTHHQSSKDACPKCGNGYYTVRQYVSLEQRYVTQRRCRTCANNNQRARREKRNLRGGSK